MFAHGQMTWKETLGTDLLLYIAQKLPLHAFKLLSALPQSTADYRGEIDRC